MKIVVDENIPFGQEAFSTLGDVVTRPGRAISKADLRDVDALAVRSVTKVNADLLGGTSVRCVATATIGTDHLDIPWLDSTGILHGSAPGCNADSVADYITACLLYVAEKQGVTLAGKTLGVVGCGNVGSRVAKRGRALGMGVLENDPPLARQTADPRYRRLEELFAADYLTLHTPLTRDGQDATYHLADAAFLNRMRPEAVLLNSSRGAVVENPALKTALRTGRISGAALDVWEGEPAIDPELAELVSLATPHIAGYSFDGKINGTTQIYELIAGWLGLEARWAAAPLLPEPEFPVLELDAVDRPDEDVLREAVLTVYLIARDDRALRESLQLGSAQARGAAFDALRKNYPRRREFALTRIELHGGSDDLARGFRQLSFGTRCGEESES